jgi:predicted porin
MSGLNAFVQVIDSIGDAAQAGGQKTAPTPSANLFGLSYSNGPIKALIDTTKFQRNASTSTADQRLRVSASYNLGVATVGLGYQTNDNTTTDVKQTLVGLNVPLNASLSAGINYVERNTKTLATNVTVKNKGYEAGVNYSLSKRTSIAASYRLINEGAFDIDQKLTRVRLMHAF